MVAKVETFDSFCVIDTLRKDNAQIVNNVLFVLK